MKNFDLRDSLSLQSPIDENLLKTLRRRAKFKQKKWDGAPPEFEKPVFIVSAPRAGSTLLFEILSNFPNVWTTGGENHASIEGIPGLHPRSKNYASNALTNKDYSPETADKLRRRLTMDLQDRDRRRYLDLNKNQARSKIRLIEKTPKNALRIPFLRSVFPDALFIFLYRDPEENIASLMEGWKSNRFIAYRNLPGWSREPWNFLLIPGWAALKKASIAEISACQWKTANRFIMDGLRNASATSWLFIKYKELIKTPEKTIKKISAFAGLKTDGQIDDLLSNALPMSRMTLSPPSPDKWRKYEKEIKPLLSELSSITKTLNKDARLI